MESDGGVVYMGGAVAGKEAWRKRKGKGGGGRSGSEEGGKEQHVLTTVRVPPHPSTLSAAFHTQEIFALFSTLFLFCIL